MLEIRSFGGLDLRLDGERVQPLGARSAEALLVYVAHQPGPVPREVAAELLWPERDQVTAAGNLRSAVYRLRKCIGHALEATRATVTLSDDVWLDTRAFETHLRDGEYEEAALLYRGDFLGGFHVDDTSEFEAWLVAERERFRQHALASHQGLLVASIADGEREKALHHAQRLIALEPLHEPAHRALIGLLVEQGLKVAALDHFERFRDQLRSEVGIDPEDATLELARSITEPAHDPIGSVAVAGSSVPQLRSQEPGRTVELPRYAAPLIGRSVELSAIEQRLASPDCRWLTVTGEGGCGKTRLAVEAAARCAGLFADGVRYLPLAGVRASEHLLPTVAQLLHLDVQPQVELAAQLTDFLRDKRSLLILDNLEQVVDGMPRLASVLRRSPGVKVLATSRVRLHLIDEWLLPIGGLAAPADAHALFAQHAARADPSFDSVAHHDEVAEICALVEGLPLALELAATWGNALSYERIAQELRQGSGLLGAPRLDLPTRHRSMERVFDGSWELLPDDLKEVFPSLAVFRGRFDADAAMQVGGASLHQLLACVDRSLLRTDPGGRFEMHELMRRYAAGRLADRGEVQSVSARHFTHYSAVAAAAKAQVFGSELEAGTEVLRAERDNIRCALEWSLSTPGYAESAAHLLDVVSWYWRLRCAWEEASVWLRKGRASSGLSAFARAALQFHAGHFALIRHDLHEAERELAASVTAFTDLGEAGSVRAAIARCSLGMTHFQLKQLAESQSEFDAALAVLEQGDDPWWAAVCHGWTGMIALARGDRDVADKEIGAALATFTRIGNRWGIGMYSATAAELRLASGDVRGADRLAAGAAAMLEDVGFDHALMSAYHLRGRIARLSGKEGEARTMFDRAADIGRRLGHRSDDEHREPVTR